MWYVDRQNNIQHALILIGMHRFNNYDIVIGTCSHLIEVLLIFLSEFNFANSKILKSCLKIVCLVVLHYDKSWQPIGCMCEPYNYFLNAIFWRYRWLADKVFSALTFDHIFSLSIKSSIIFDIQSTLLKCMNSKVVWCKSFFLAFNLRCMHDIIMIQNKWNINCLINSINFISKMS